MRFNLRLKSISFRLTVALVLAATLPLFLVGLGGQHTLQQANKLAVEQSEAALTEEGQNAILQTAKSIAHQIELYLNLHPEIDLNNYVQLESNTALAKIAVQPVGQTGYTAVFDADGITHFHDNPKIVGLDMSTLATERPEFWAIFAAALDGSPSDGYYDWEDEDGQIRPKYMSIVPVGDTQLRVAATTYIDDFFDPIVKTRAELEAIQRDARTQLFWALMGAALVAVAGALVLGRQFSQPIRDIADAAARVAAGELRSLDLPERDDEIGTLAHAFNTMTAQLSDLISRLEARTEELSQYAADLEQTNRQNQRRTVQLETSAQIARTAASELDPDQLLNRVVHLISEQFGHYHAGAFLLDETGRWATLQATNSKGGQRLLARGYRLAIDSQSSVGHVISTGQPRITFKKGADAIYFDNPDLPNSLSQISLPLIARDQIIGILDVHSTQEAAFDAEDAVVLGSLADQVAVALDNARLYRASQNALAQVQALQRQHSREDWDKYSSHCEADFYEYRQDSVDSGAQEHLSEAEKVLREGVISTTADGNGRPAAVVAPIKVRGQVIGALGLQGTNASGGRRDWSADEVALVETIADQVAQAMEAARLFDEAQRRAQQEQLVIEISDKIRSAPDIDGILRTTVREIRRALGASHGLIRLGTETHLRPPEDSAERPQALLAPEATQVPPARADEQSESGERQEPGYENPDTGEGDN